jgi:isoaspartyl peptidase/L-asparaginase-like protein (Ntn-hydrolase superfamily)
MDFCRTCFDRIPRDIRQRMRAARDAKAAHLSARAVSDAMTWLREHPLTSAGRGAVE